jgi:septum formation protein
MGPSKAPLICLASASPRRSALLAQIGVPHRIAPALLDERPQQREVPADYVARLAVRKAREAAARPELSGGLPVLGADTSVIVDGRILGKPRTLAEQHEMLTQLAGRTHEVLTAIALVSGRALAVRLSRTLVRMRRLRPAEIDAYWASGEPRDKAGGYAIQGLAAVFIEHIEGSYSGVMGLPLYETAELLAAAGVPLWSGSLVGAGTGTPGP